MTEQINLNIVDGEPFFAHEVSVNFTPTQFTFDFKCITPRTDPRSKNKASFLLKHNVVMIEPWHAKLMLGVLNKVVKRYEEEFGIIKKPNAIAKAQRKSNKKVDKEGKSTETPSYFG